MKNSGVAPFSGINRFMVLPFSPRTLDFRTAGPQETKNLAGKSPPPDSDPFNDAEFGNNLQAWQDKLLSANLTHSSLAKILWIVQRCLRRRSATADSSCGEFARLDLRAHPLQT